MPVPNTHFTVAYNNPVGRHCRTPRSAQRRIQRRRSRPLQWIVIRLAACAPSLIDRSLDRRV
jgi:hypothetical protein